MSQITSTLEYSRKLKEKIFYQKHTYDEVKEYFDSKVFDEFNVKVIVENKDTLDCAKQFDSVICLNFASEYKFGGGWLNGRQAQEETLMLRSSYNKFSSQKLYPLKDNELVYSKDVTVFKDNKLNFCEHYTVSFIACAALRKPKLINNKYSKQDKLIMQQKIDMIFLTAMAYGYQNIVLGAFGCGVFYNPPNEVAELFKIAINKYGKYFKNIYFAIIAKNYDKYDNYSIFKYVLEQ